MIIKHKKRIKNKFHSAKVSIEKLYDLYAEDIYRYALMILADHNLAEDAVQQIFLKLLNMGKDLCDIQSYDSYLKISIRNEAYNIIRKRERFCKFKNNMSTEPLLENYNDFASENERVLIENILNELPAEQREIIYLKIYENKTFLEIGKLTNTSINTVTSRYRYGISKLKKILSSESYQKE